MSVSIGTVETFADVRPDKAQVMKIAEEVMEVFSAWETMETECCARIVRMCDCKHCDEHERETGCGLYDHLLDECADVIQATANLLVALGVEDFAPVMERCRERNAARDRF